MNSATKAVLVAELAAAVEAHRELVLARMRTTNGTADRRSANAALFAAEKAVAEARAKLAPKKAPRGTRRAEVDCNTGRVFVTTVR